MVLRLLRGGSWNNNPRNCRSANRNRNARDNRNNNVGFRVVVAAPLSTLLLSELMNGNSSGVPKKSPDLLQ
ncbi:SUMF1/EgtB/PvdO family nonheme iron enzyme [Nostoc sp. CHAB 5784]|uniref:SUMF1/EgtB/PvdO family nonheme iron enzyme n=1 Tax=Nostoc mirabile TaxID=2907820 RepID=UPI001E4965C6|nr:SUMF1/EgtB/PvdO family nonheme iron enzyme [Nostoc mirabile]MCC5667134.1 SUMF1/EgtB/PvdO family nonheme iron enzyme [Nostoc mirabile CHAB5784]